jgi:hypothetical protein
MAEIEPPARSGSSWNIFSTRRLPVLHSNGRCGAVWANTDLFDDLIISKEY